MIRWLMRIPAPERYAIIWLGFLAFLDVALTLWFRSMALFPGPFALVLLPAPPVFAILYGFYRARSFHPLGSHKYYQWLRSTPWSAEKPLPLGPVLLGLRDALVFACTLLYAVLHLPLVIVEKQILAYVGCVIAGLLFPYVLAATGVGFVTRQRRTGYFLVVLIGLGIRFIYLPEGALGILLAAVAVSQVVMHRSLRRYPWEGAGYWAPADAGKPSPWQSLFDDPQAKLGWPYAGLAPKPWSPPTSRQDTVLVALVAGWLVYVATAMFETLVRMDEKFVEKGGDITGGAVFVYVVGILVAMLVRLMLYCAAGQIYAAPLTPFGRLFSGRLIIPGYDRVYVAPLLTLLVGAAVPCLGHSMGASTAASLGLGTACFLLTAFLAGPSLEEWRLTGRWSLRPLRRSSQQRRPQP